jgi:hypothetical protein
MDAWMPGVIGLMGWHPSGKRFSTCFLLLFNKGKKVPGKVKLE